MRNLVARLHLAPVLGVGVTARIAVWALLAPFNNDDHIGVINWILRTGRLPTSEVGNQTFQPPLYYLLALPWTVGRSLKLLQAFSLVLSLANFLLLYRFLRDTTLVRDQTARRRALWLIALLPQFVIFGNFISNDTLAFPVGTLILLQTLRYVGLPDTRNLMILAISLGVGLLTKGTFLAFVPVLVCLVIVTGIRMKWSWRRRTAAIALFCVVAGALGTYKFVENFAHFGRPIVHNMEFRSAWMVQRQATYRGIRSFVDFDLVWLIGHPFHAERTLNSYPMLPYATFWYSYILESSFQATRMRFPIVTQAIAAGAVLPTVLILIGAAAAAGRFRRLLRISALDEEEVVPRMRAATVLVLFLANLAIVMAAGIKFDSWSCFQGRLLFPSILAVALFLAWGLEVLKGLSPKTARAAAWGTDLVFVLFGAYLLAEVGTAFLMRFGIG